MKKLFTVFLTMLICFYCGMPLTGHALDFDPERIHLEYSIAPEGTAYIDVLAKIDEDDASYTNLNVVPRRVVDKVTVNGTSEFVYEPLAIDENSEIAKYNEDGYVSLSIHSSDIKSYNIYSDDTIQLELTCYADDFYNKYQKCKLAYVSENGEVLMVTHETDSTSDPTEPYAFVADGKRAVYRSFGISETGIIFAIFVSLAILVLIVTLPVFLIIKIIVRITRNRKAIKNTHDKNDQG